MIQLQFPVVRSPWDDQDYLVLLDAPEYDRQPGYTLEHMRVVGINRKRQYKQFTLPKADWQKAEQRMVTFCETPLTPKLIQVPTGSVVAGSKIKEPWRVAFTVIGDMVAMYVRSFGSKTHYTVAGVKRDGTPFEVIMPQHDFDRHNQNPTWFVEVASKHAPIARAPNAPSLES